MLITMVPAFWALRQTGTSASSRRGSRWRSPLCDHLLDEVNLSADISSSLCRGDPVVLVGARLLSPGPVLHGEKGLLVKSF
jgi:hypothetical protein